MNADERRFWPELPDSTCPVICWTLHWQIADMNADFVPDAARDHDLEFVFYGDDGHRLGITVEPGYPARNARRATGDENTMLVVGTPKSSSFSTTRPNSVTLPATTFKMNASPPAT
jgi:hypothetical protein